VTLVALLCFQDLFANTCLPLLQENKLKQEIRSLTQQLKLLREKLSVQEGTELKPGGHSKRKHSGLPEDQHEKKRKPDQVPFPH
jgi:hypothetical protein